MEIMDMDCLFFPFFFLPNSSFYYYYFFPSQKGHPPWAVQRTLESYLNTQLWEEKKNPKFI